MFATRVHSALTLLVATSVPAMLDTLGMECSVMVGKQEQMHTWNTCGNETDRVGSSHAICTDLSKQLSHFRLLRHFHDLWDKECRNQPRHQHRPLCGLIQYG